MKKSILFVILSFSLWTSAYSQKKEPASKNPYARIDEVVDRMPDTLSTIPAVAAYIHNSFSSEYERARAIFYWVTEHVRYAPKLMYSFTTNENRSRLARDVFENRAGICLGYAVLFDTLCKLNQVESYIVLGSTRQSFLPTIIGHAWNAVKIFDVWQVADPTWGSGYLQGANFVKKRNNQYFFPDPEKLIASHLPLDPIWQLLKRPVTLYQFHSHLQSTIRTDWNYQDSIREFLGMDELGKLKSGIRRLEQFGNNSEVTSNYYNYLRAKELEYYSTKLNFALRTYNQGVELFNTYIDFKNHQFEPVKPDAEVKEMMPAIRAKMDQAEQEYKLIISKITEESYIESISSYLKQIDELRKRIEEESKFVDKYLLTKKNKRRDLFYTKIHTINGIPVKR